MFSPICYVFLFLKNRFEINKVLSLFFPKPQECEQTRLLANVEPNFTWTMDWHPILFNLFCQYRFICFFQTKIASSSNTYSLSVFLVFLLYLRGHRSLFSQLDSGQCHPTPPFMTDLNLKSTPRRPQVESNLPDLVERGKGNSIIANYHHKGKQGNSESQCQLLQNTAPMGKDAINLILTSESQCQK